MKSGLCGPLRSGLDSVSITVASTSPRCNSLTPARSCRKPCLKNPYTPWEKQDTVALFSRRQHVKSRASSHDALRTADQHHNQPGRTSNGNKPTLSRVRNSSLEGLEQVAAQVEHLQRLVQVQQQLIDQQQATLQQMKAELATARAPAGQTQIPEHAWDPQVSPFDSQRVGIGDRRLLGLFDARFHSTSPGAMPKDYRILPDRIILVRHAESEGNVDNVAYTYIPDAQVPLTERGFEQARQAGIKIRNYIESKGDKVDCKLFFYTSPYKRSLQTYEGISVAFPASQITGMQEEVQLREQDFGNFQDLEGKRREKAERLRFGRFYYRFPNGESGADVYDRITIFEDHMIRDINAGRFAKKTNLVLVTHGLALRVFLMRWFHWTVAQFLEVYNAPNAEPLILERVAEDITRRAGSTQAWMHTKSLYRLTDTSMAILRGCTADMCSSDHMPRKQQHTAGVPPAAVDL